MSKWSDASKRVGHQNRSVVWPTLEEVKDAIAGRDADAVITWSRFLPSPQTKPQVEIIRVLYDGLRDVRTALESEDATRPE